MVLDRINQANDIKYLNEAQLEELPGEIRQFLIEHISKTGGHLASNLGVVELTMALHLVLNFPEDKLIWDVGHQSYTHKILTGRKREFEHLRQLDGISGFPKRSESDCDAFDTGHSSTSISAGLGYARARDLLGEDYHVVSVIGDGALTGGPAFEALNNAAEAFGSTIRVSDDEVPTVIGSIVSTEEEAEALKVPEIGTGRTQIYIDAIEKACKLITDRPVLAGVIGPFSLAGRLLDVSEALIYCYDEPDMVHIVLQKVTEFLINYCNEYKKVGANGIVMAEPLAGLLSPDLAQEFSADYVKQIVDAVQDDNFLVVYHNCGNTAVKTIDTIVTNAKTIYVASGVQL